MRDGISMLCGRRIGDGLSREVYVFRWNTNMVIKIEVGNEHQNAIEYSTWTDIANGPLARYFAPCRMISPYGAWLVMERTTVPGPRYKWPTTFPAMFTDFKRSNYGLNSKGKLVCHDYGTNLAMHNSGFNTRAKKCEWWE